MSYTAHLEKISKITIEHKEVVDQIVTIIGNDNFKRVKQLQRDAMSLNYLYSVMAKVIKPIKAKKVLNKPLKEKIVNEMIKPSESEFLNELRDIVLRTPINHIMNALRKRYKKLTDEVAELCNNDDNVNDLLVKEATINRDKAAARMALNSTHGANTVAHGLTYNRETHNQLAKDFEGDELTPHKPTSFYEEHLKLQQKAENQQWKEHAFGETVAEGQPYKVADQTESNHVETKAAELAPPPAEVNIDPTSIDETIPEVIPVVLPDDAVVGNFIPVDGNGEIIPGGVMLDENGKLLPDSNGEYPKGHQLQVTGRLKKSEPTYLQLSEKHNPDKK